MGRPFFLVQVPPPAQPTRNPEPKGRATLLRHVPAEPQQPPHAPMSKIHGLAIHHRTPAHDALNTVRTAGLDRLRRDTACAKGAMEPHATHIALPALIHDLDGIARMRDNHHTVYNSGDRSQVGIAPLVLDLARRGVHRENLESRTAELPKNGVRRLLRIS